MKKLWCFLVLIFVALSLAGCSNNIRQQSNNDIIYKDEKYGFTFVFPSTWRDKYYVDYLFNTVRIHHKATWQKNGEGTLFTIHIFKPKDKWNTEGILLVDTVGMQKIYENANEAIGYSSPTDVQYIIEDNKLRNEYAQMEKDVYNIVKSFKKNN